MLLLHPRTHAEPQDSMSDLRADALALARSARRLTFIAIALGVLSLALVVASLVEVF